MPSTARWVLRSPAVVHEVIDGEAVIINLESGAYFSADGAGATAWQLIAGGGSAADLAAMLAAHHDAEPGAIAEAATRFVDLLQREGLIRPAQDEDAAPAAPPAPPPGAKPALPPLELRVFTDLQELLLLDPIHDVDETGWPAPPPRR